MINVVHINVHYNDTRDISSVELKLKSIKNGKLLTSHELNATVAVAFFQTTILADVGKSVKITPNPRRREIINIFVSFDDGNNLTLNDIANFVSAFQKALDETSLF